MFAKHQGMQQLVEESDDQDSTSSDPGCESDAQQSDDQDSKSCDPGCESDDQDCSEESIPAPKPKRLKIQPLPSSNISDPCSLCGEELQGEKYHGVLAHRSCMLAHRALRARVKNNPKRQQAFKGLKKNSPQDFMNLLNHVKGTRSMSSAGSRVARRAGFEQAVTMLDAYIRTNTSRRRRKSILLNKGDFLDHMQETKNMNRKDAKKLWKKSMKDPTVKKAVEDGKTVIVKRKPTEVHSDEEVTCSKGIEADEFEKEKKDAKELLDNCGNLPRPDRSRKRKLEAPRPKFAPRATLTTDTDLGSEVTPKKKRATKKIDLDGLEKIQQLASRTNSSQAKLALDKRLQQKKVQESLEKFKVDGVDANIHITKLWKTCQDEPDIKGMAVESTISACMAAKQVMEDKCKEVDDWIVTDNLERKRSELEAAIETFNQTVAELIDLDGILAVSVEEKKVKDRSSKKAAADKLRNSEKRFDDPVIGKLVAKLSFGQDLKQVQSIDILEFDGKDWKRASFFGRASDMTQPSEYHQGLSLMFSQWGDALQTKAAKAHESITGKSGGTASGIVVGMKVMDLTNVSKGSSFKDKEFIGTTDAKASFHCSLTGKLIWETANVPFAGLGQMITCSAGTLFAVILDVSELIASGYTLDRVPAYLNSESLSVKGQVVLPAGCSLYVPFGKLAIPVGIPTKWCDGIVSYYVQLLNCVEDMVEVVSASAAQQITCWVEMSLARESKVIKACSAQAKLILKEAKNVNHLPDPAAVTVDAELSDA